MQNIERWAKLDEYDYEFIYGQSITGYWGITAVRIMVDGNSDSDITDIVSEITATDGFVYVEGHYFKIIEYTVIHELDEMQWYLDISVGEF